MVRSEIILKLVVIKIEEIVRRVENTKFIGLQKLLKKALQSSSKCFTILRKIHEINTNFSRLLALSHV